VLPGQIDEVPEQGEYDLIQTETAVLAAFDDAGVELWRTELDGKPTDVVVVDGDPWVAREDWTVSRINASDGRILDDVTIEDEDGHALGVSRRLEFGPWAFGSVWVAPVEPSGPGGLVRGRLIRIDPDLSTTSIEIPPVHHQGDSGLDAPEAGAGAIWVPLGEGGVAMIDPDTLEVTVIPVDDIGHEVLSVAFDGDVAYVATRYQVTSIVDGEVLDTVSPGEIWYLGPMDGAFGVLLEAGRFEVLRANDPMVVEHRQISLDGQTGPVAEIDGEAWMEIGRNYDLRRVESTPTG